RSAHGSLLSCPTRRSSDLIPAAFLGARYAVAGQLYFVLLGLALILPTIRLLGITPKEHAHSKPVHVPLALLMGAVLGGLAGMLRSEEHTSELQSRENLVCR